MDRSTSMFLAGVGCGVVAAVIACKLGRSRAPACSYASSASQLAEVKSATGIEYVGAAIPDDVEVVSKTAVESGTKWLKFSIIQFISRSRMKIPCAWEMVERATTTAEVDGADAFAIIRSPDHEPRVILLLGYRAPVAGVTVELPSGLVDAGESATTAAVRELKEETGYSGKVVGSSGTVWVDPWKSTETCCVVFMEVDGTLPENLNPQPDREEMELQQVVLVPLATLLGSLNHLEGKGYKIDARLRSLAMGLALAPALT